LSLSDLWVYDATANAWLSQPARGDVPPGRAFHAHYSVGPLLTVFGGYVGADMCDTRFHVYDARAGVWTAHDPAAGGVAHSHRLQGDWGAHLMQSHNKVVLFGNRYSDDVNVFDLDERSGVFRVGGEVARVVKDAQSQKKWPEVRRQVASVFVPLSDRDWMKTIDGGATPASSAPVVTAQARLLIFGGLKVQPGPPVCSSGMRCMYGPSPLAFLFPWS
jgi:hypothetical protein